MEPEAFVNYLQGFSVENLHHLSVEVCRFIASHPPSDILDILKAKRSKGATNEVYPTKDSNVQDNHDVNLVDDASIFCDSGEHINNLLSSLSANADNQPVDNSSTSNYSSLAGTVRLSRHVGTSGLFIAKITKI